MIILHSHLQPQLKNELFHILHINNDVNNNNKTDDDDNYDGDDINNLNEI